MGLLKNTMISLGLTQPGPKITPQDKAILDLKVQRDKMKQYQKRLQVVLDREQEIAKEALKTGDKRRALTALRQRKFQEGLLTKTDGQLQTLQELVASIEFTQIQATVMKGLEMGNDVLKELHREMSLDRVERLMDNTRDGVEYQREVDEALMSRMSPEEEEAVQAELEALQREAMPAVPDTLKDEPVALPDAPNTEPVEPVEAVNGSERQSQRESEGRVALPA